MGLASQTILTAWPDGEFADLRLIEVGADLNSVQVGDVEKVFAGGDEIVGGDGNGVDGSGEGGADVVVGIGCFCGGDGGTRVGELSFCVGTIGCAVALGSARLKAFDGAFRGDETLLGRGDLAGGGGSLLLQGLKGREIFCCLLLLLLCAAEIAGESDALVLRSALTRCREDLPRRSAPRRSRLLAGQCVGVIHLDQKIACFYLLANIDVHFLDDAWSKRIGRKLLDGLDLSVGRYGAHDVLVVNDCDANTNQVAGGRAHNDESDNDNGEEDAPQHYRIQASCLGRRHQSKVQYIRRRMGSDRTRNF